MAKSALPCSLVNVSTGSKPLSLAIKLVVLEISSVSVTIGEGVGPVDEDSPLERSLHQCSTRKRILANSMTLSVLVSTFVHDLGCTACVLAVSFTNSKTEASFVAIAIVVLLDALNDGRRGLLN